MFVMKCFFVFNVSINHFLNIHRSVLCRITIDLLYFWDVYDISVWEKVTITVKLCFIETRLKQCYDLWCYFLKIARVTINIVTITDVHYFAQWTSFRSSRSEVFYKKVVLKIARNLQQKPYACGMQLYWKRGCGNRCLNFVILLRTTCLIEHLLWLLLLFSFKKIFPSFYIKTTRL